MPGRKRHDRHDAPDSLHLSGADLRAIRRKAAMDVIEDRDPDRLVRLLDAIYRKGLRDGILRGRRQRGHR
jgi:hypothetical protein